MRGLLDGTNVSGTVQSVNKARGHHRVVRFVGTVRGEVAHFRGHPFLVVDVTHRNDAREILWILLVQLLHGLDTVHAVDHAELPPVQDSGKRTTRERSFIPHGRLHLFTKPALMGRRHIVLD